MKAPDLRPTFASQFLRLKEGLSSNLARISAREEGQGMVEYALILVLIAMVIIVILSIVGKQVRNVFSNVNDALN
jgi:pilus assembly protein Flp/PilA